MGTDISKVAKSIIQMQTGVKTDKSSKKADKDTMVSFMELMSQNTLQSGIQTNISNDTAKLDVGAGISQDARLDYNSNAAAANNVSVKEKVTPDAIKEEASEPLADYEQDIRNVLKEEFSVTDEEITQAMEELGLGFLDLRNMQNLTNLIQTLTGEDIGTLLLSDAFTNAMEQITAVTDDLCAQLGITREELDVLCEAWDQAAASDEAETVLPDAVEAETTADTQANTETVNAKQTDDTKASQTAAADGVEVTVVKQDDNATEDQTTAVTDTKEAVTTVETTEQTAEDMTGSSGENADQQEHFKQSKETRADMSDTGVHVTGHQSVQTEEFVLPTESTQPYTTSQIDVNDVINQIARNVRVTISEAATSMEMQLNPEHLGKIYLNISEREGVIRAQITAQNEAVKEALETQLVELRTNLSQQGIKVDAVEVTVGTHEFEQNLEGNAKQEEQQGQQMEESQKQTRRNLNLDDLDGLSGLMTEEEQLAAQIMRDNGNQVDYTA
ncbi:flagellar hook-length control protein FliK [Roseburia sp. BX1005]|uniref:Flagellar hook-length control protein FliK n=1 Tax=Roseburia zhanii TaxID=2763064 RepID=A0A923RS60_9FIRM|nr:flagellar hook-length control protein FliK [Roseburia zhanii]MBC5713287.1 flagellar hook-length control protein FliK [Roseburia zhanii]